MVWNYTRANIIDRALRICGVLPSSQSASTTQVSNAVVALQAILEDLNNQGYKNTQVEWVTKALVASSQVIGYKCKRSHLSSASDEPGVGANWQKFWEVDATALAGAWAGSSSYLSIRDIVTGTDTVDVLLCYLQDSTSRDVEIPLQAFTMQEYHDIVDKYSTGSPYAYYLEEGTPPRIIFFYEPDATTYIVNYVRIKKMTSIDNASDSLDAEKRWWDAVTYKLAAHLADEYVIPLERAYKIENKAEKMIKQAKRKDFYVNHGTSCSFGAYDMRSY